MPALGLIRLREQLPDPRETLHSWDRQCVGHDSGTAGGRGAQGDVRDGAEPLCPRQHHCPPISMHPRPRSSANHLLLGFRGRLTPQQDGSNQWLLLVDSTSTPSRRGWDWGSPGHWLPARWGPNAPH